MFTVEERLERSINRTTAIVASLSIEPNRVGLNHEDIQAAALALARELNDELYWLRQSLPDDVMKALSLTPDERESLKRTEAWQ